jgi:hypothetical protein
MSGQRRHFGTDQKAAILKRCLVDKVPLSDLCDEYAIKPNQKTQGVTTAYNGIGSELFSRPEVPPVPWKIVPTPYPTSVHLMALCIPISRLGRNRHRLWPCHLFSSTYNPDHSTPQPSSGRFGSPQSSLQSLCRSRLFRDRPRLD